MSDRLNKLQQQKRLIEEHLRWLEEEIVVESKGSISDKVPERNQSPIPVPQSPPSSPEKSVSPQKRESETGPKDQAEEISEEIITRYSNDPGRKEMDPKMGCILYVAGAVGFISLVIYAIYWFGYR